VSTESLASAWIRLSPLVDTVLDAPPERRAALIAELSGGDPARQSELERLLADCEHEAPLLAHPAAARFASLLEAHEAEFPESLADRYELKRELGRGGMATVYLARDRKHERDVAVKVVHRTLVSTLGSEGFLREIAIVAQLRHPHIVPLFDSGNADGVLYYVMPFEPGPSLRDRLAREGPLPVEDVVTILHDICDALAHAHACGVVHRDIKPDNVLLSGRHALVADFGIAKALARSVGPAAQTGLESPIAATRGVPTLGAALGTPAYMAAEQIAGDPGIDHRADIYSVGVLAYELLAGRRPFAGETRKDLLAAHLMEAPTPLVVYRPDAPPALIALVMRCLEKRPGDRWQTAEELVHQLDAVVTAERAPTDIPARVRWSVMVATVAALAAVVSVLIWQRTAASATTWRTRWANARIERLTDFPGSEVDAAISADGQLVAFLADRDSTFDAFVTRVGSGQFRNLTRGTLPELLNEDVRNVGFSADDADVWVRAADIASPASVSLFPTLGGRPRPFLGTAVMVVWSPDGSRLAYHETTPGDPIYVADRTGANARRIFIAEAGVHNHHLAWSPDGRFLYFTHGLPPNEMDVWRIPSDGGRAERMTTLASGVAYPLPLDDQTLLFTATAEDGTGPWLYDMDVRSRKPERVTSTVEHYVSIAAAHDVPGQPRRLVATVSNPVVDLWAVPITRGIAPERAASRIQLPTARAAGPRFLSDGSLLYLASRSGADGVWRLSGKDAAPVWSPPSGAVAGPVAVSPDGQRACAPVRRQERTTLFCMSADGTGARALGTSLDVRGAASWSPDGKWIAIGAKDGPGVRLFKIPTDGGAPVRLVDSVSSNPVWSPDGAFILYSGTPRARSVPVKAVTADGRPYPFPTLTVDRVGDSYRFLPGGTALVVKLGGFRRQDFWLVDIASGQRRQLTKLRPGESLHRFDVSPDGKRIVFERVRENSDIALITLPAGRHQ
jgi:Tol biopolymer transport system component